jgi:hypothetical protein
LGAYDSNKLQTLSDSVTYLDFSQIEVLLQFGLTTSELNYFHVTATASLSVGALLTVKPTLDFYISVDGATVRVVGYIHGIPLITFVNGSHYANVFAGNGTREVTFYYQTGYVYLHGVDDYDGTNHDETDDVKVKDTYFVSNILHYLMADILEASDTIQSQVTSSTSSSSSDPVKYEDVLTGFEYANASGYDPSWKTTLDIGALTNNSALKTLTLNFSGSDKDNSDQILDGYLNHMYVNFTMNAGTSLLGKLITIDLTMTADLKDVGTDYTEWFQNNWQPYIDAHANATVEGA